ncbi:hypothetical protein DXG03_008023 [Asterophora parasitica]|uniref:Uncharacterized protein n=1 Tax=Asterophora parasitica TaxID=117018 RepID=A0A9P7KEA6_9AGAR|nr:hypothetical protein DXG03_008023 [Asterophora parasitica]
MRGSLIRLAESVTAKPLNLREASATLFPPIPYARISEWKVYLDELPRDAHVKSFSGKKLDATVFEKMSAEQLGQLYELMHATKDVWKPIPEQVS